MCRLNLKYRLVFIWFFRIYYDRLAQAFFRFRIEVLRGLIFLNVKQYLLTLNSRLKGSPDLSFIFHSSVELWQCRNGFERQNNTYLSTSYKVTKATCLAYVQLNEYETDPYFLELSHHLTSYCFEISEDLHRFARNLQHLLTKLFLLLFLNNFRRQTIRKTIL